MTDNNLYTRQPGEIVMYSVDWCPDCKRAKFFFTRKKIAYREVNVDNDEQAADFVREINDGKRSVPTIIFPDGSVMVEPSTEELNERFSKS
jgi:mycoredoxin